MRKLYQEQIFLRSLRCPKCRTKQVVYQIGFVLEAQASVPAPEEIFWSDQLFLVKKQRVDFNDLLIQSEAPLK